jgi:hypothetical protein
MQPYPDDFTAMATDASVLRFKQWNNFKRIEFVFHPDYVEFYVGGGRGKSTGFNVKYELLPGEFYYRTFRPKDMYVRFPLVLVALNAVIALSSHEGSAYALLIISVVIGLICCAIGYGLRRFVKKEYTVLATPAGNPLIAKDNTHDQIVRELQKRRVDALKKAAFVNPLAEHWQEIQEVQMAQG